MGGIQALRGVRAATSPVKTTSIGRSTCPLCYQPPPGSLEMKCFSVTQATPLRASSPRGPAAPSRYSPVTEAGLLDGMASTGGMRDGGDDTEPRPKRPRLTRKNLAPLEKMERKKTSAPTEESTDSSTSPSTTSTASITPSVFATQASRNGILRPHNSKPPTNLDAIRQRHARSRTSASPSESDFRHYVNKVRGACNKTTMLYEVSWKLLKAYNDDKEYTKTISQAFDRFPRGVGFNDGLPPPAAGLCRGAGDEGVSPV